VPCPLHPRVRSRLGPSARWVVLVLKQYGFFGSTIQSSLTLASSQIAKGGRCRKVYFRGASSLAIRWSRSFRRSGLPEGAAPAAPASVTRTELQSFARKEREPANCKWPGDGGRFSVIVMDRGMQLDGTSKSRGRISRKSCSDRAAPAHRATCRLGGRSVGAIGGRRWAESFR
jgi:hypothetical protein